MFTNILKTIETNKKNFDHIPGRRFFYSPQICWLTVSIGSITLAAYIYFLITSPDLIMVWLLGFVAFGYLILGMFHKLIYKNPLFIINRNILFYTKTEKYYDLTKCSLKEDFAGKYNFSMTLKLTDKFNNDSFAENFWYIEYDGELRTILRPFYAD